MMVFKVLPTMTKAKCGVALSCLALLAGGQAAAQGLRLPGESGRGPALTAPFGAPASSPSSSSGSGATSSPGGTSSSRIQLGDAIVAIVNSDVITRRELDGRVQTALATLARQQIPAPDRNTLERQVLERMIVEKTQLQEAAQLGIRIDDMQLDRAINRIAEQNHVTVSQMRDQIEREGVPFSVYREDLRQELTLLRLRERAVDSQIQVSEPEIDAYLAEEHEAAPSEMTLAQILVRVPEGSSSDMVARLRRKAEALLEQLRNGADFARLAAASSDGEEALRGGDLGTRPADRWPSLFVEAVSQLSPGGISEIIQSGNGFHILKLVDRKSTGGPGSPAMPVQQTHARHILIRPTAVLSSEQARERLVNIRQRIVQGGANFADMARQYSNDASAPQGGDLGWLSPQETVPEFERAMDALKPGEVSEPIQSPFGWHLIQVIERRTQDVGRERQRQAARQALFQRKLDQLYEDWARELRDKAYVEIRLGDSPSENPS
ncbi:peptidylprolyl isomerase [uncultured Pigmentiphaga sp.]|jgi:Parvulin-like peptidyl-prolyl isomerase|uniref:peptidylprolyl isomerase n=1 Tax=uncultured Pigmentiphaga sp. TaxID=340361 RepID=UPI002602A97E|nr:peptidylprolyl isomerase [uncultured Pigmentiphaga sp.]